MSANQNSVYDHELVARLRMSDESAFDALYMAYYAKLWRYAYSYAKSRDVAEEIVQDVFFAVWDRRERWTVDDNIEGYLYASVRNTAQKYRRHLRVVADNAESVAWHHFPTGSATAEPTAQEQLEFIERIAAVRHAVASLPERHRRVVMLRWKQQMTYSEVAETLGVSVKAVRVAMEQVQRTLRALLRGITS